MAFNECYKTCGVSMEKCKNRYCEINPHYSTPVVKEKPKGGPGKPSTKARAQIKKENSKSRYSSMFNIED